MKPHHTDGVSLTFGLIFLAILAAWMFGSAVHVSLPNPGWFLAGALIVFGLLGLVGMLRSDRHKASDPASVDPDDA